MTLGTLGHFTIDNIQFILTYKQHPAVLTIITSVGQGILSIDETNKWYMWLLVGKLVAWHMEKTCKITFIILGICVLVDRFVNVCSCLPIDFVLEVSGDFAILFKHYYCYSYCHTFKMFNGSGCWWYSISLDSLGKKHKWHK